MISNAVKNGNANKNIIIETLMSLKRSGASAIVTYFALEIANRIKKGL